MATPEALMVTTFPAILDILSLQRILERDDSSCQKSKYFLGLIPLWLEAAAASDARRRTLTLKRRIGDIRDVAGHWYARCCEMV